MKRKFGFTLLELLVVISIIGILMAMGAVAFSVAQKKGRDARRVSDMKAIQNAFEQYNAQNGGSYNASSSVMASGVSFTMPLDPKTNLAYTESGFSTSAYCVCADVEDDKGNSTSSACAFANAGTRTHFCVKNLQ